MCVCGSPQGEGFRLAMSEVVGGACPKGLRGEGKVFPGNLLRSTEQLL